MSEDTRKATPEGSMTCAAVIDSFRSFLLNELGKEGKERVVKHVERCPVCSQKLLTMAVFLTVVCKIELPRQRRI